MSRLSRNRHTKLIEIHFIPIFFLNNLVYSIKKKINIPLVREIWAEKLLNLLKFSLPPSIYFSPSIRSQYRRSIKKICTCCSYALRYDRHNELPGQLHSVHVYTVVFPVVKSSNPDTCNHVLNKTST